MSVTFVESIKRTSEEESITKRDPGLRVPDPFDQIGPGETRPMIGETIGPGATRHMIE